MSPGSAPGREGRQDFQSTSRDSEASTNLAALDGADPNGGDHPCLLVHRETDRETLSCLTFFDGGRSFRYTTRMKGYLGVRQALMRLALLDLCFLKHYHHHIVDKAPIVTLDANLMQSIPSQYSRRRELQVTNVCVTPIVACLEVLTNVYDNTRTILRASVTCGRARVQCRMRSSGPCRVAA